MATEARVGAVVCRYQGVVLGYRIASPKLSIVWVFMFTTSVMTVPCGGLVPSGWEQRLQMKCPWSLTTARLSRTAYRTLVGYASPF